MWVSASPVNQQLRVLEWFREYTNFFNKNGNEKKIKFAEKIFIETYFENIQEGMETKDALQRAKTVALCFLILNDE
jgi:hypothetical protein